MFNNQKQFIPYNKESTSYLNKNFLKRSGHNDLPTLYIKDSGLVVQIYDHYAQKNLRIVSLKGNLSQIGISEIRHIIEAVAGKNCQVVLGSAPLLVVDEIHYCVDKCLLKAENDPYLILPVKVSQAPEVTTETKTETPINIEVKTGLSIGTNFPTQGPIPRVTIWNNGKNESAGFIVDDIKYDSTLDHVRSLILKEDLEDRILQDSQQWVFMKPDSTLVILAEEGKIQAHQVLRNHIHSGRNVIAFYVEEYKKPSLKISILDQDNKSIGLIMGVAPDTTLLSLQKQVNEEEIIQSGQSFSFMWEGDPLSTNQAAKFDVQKIWFQKDGKTCINILMK